MAGLCSETVKEDPRRQGHCSWGLTDEEELAMGWGRRQGVWGE